MKQKSIEEVMHALAETKPRASPLSGGSHPLEWMQWEKDVRAVAHCISIRNPGFSFDRFYRGVGLHGKQS